MISEPTASPKAARPAAAATGRRGRAIVRPGLAHVKDRIGDRPVLLTDVPRR